MSQYQSNQLLNYIHWHIQCYWCGIHMFSSHHKQINIHGHPFQLTRVRPVKVSMHRPKAVMPWLHHKLFAWKTVAIAIEDWGSGPLDPLSLKR